MQILGAPPGNIERWRAGATALLRAYLAPGIDGASEGPWGLQLPRAFHSWARWKHPLIPMPCHRQVHVLAALPNRKDAQEKNEASSILLFTPNMAKPLHLPPMTSGTMHEIVVRRISESHAGDARNQLANQAAASKARRVEPREMEYYDVHTVASMR